MHRNTNRCHKHFSRMLLFDSVAPLCRGRLLRHMRTTYESDDGQHFESEDDCQGYERLLPIIREVLDSIENIELGENDSKSFLRDLRTHLNPSCFERYLFDNRKEIATLADLLNCVVPPHCSADKGVR